jgi:hypothetical protein
MAQNVSNKMRWWRINSKSTPAAEKWSQRFYHLESDFLTNYKNIAENELLNLSDAADEVLLEDEATAPMQFGSVFVHYDQVKDIIYILIQQNNNL